VLRSNPLGEFLIKQLRVSPQVLRRALLNSSTLSEFFDIITSGAKSREALSEIKELREGAMRHAVLQDLNLMRQSTILPPIVEDKDLATKDHVGDVILPDTQPEVSQGLQEKKSPTRKRRTPKRAPQKD